jgi:hypothetical protein
LIDLTENEKEQNWKRTKKMNIFSFDIFICRRDDRVMRNMIEYDWIWLNMIKDKRAILRRHIIQMK